MNEKGEKVTISSQCPMCKGFSRVEVDRVAYDRFMAGVHIQVAFPDLEPDQREIMITGTCSGCWNKMFPKRRETKIKQSAVEHGTQRSSGSA